jgi:hypothetical protein
MMTVRDAQESAAFTLLALCALLCGFRVLTPFLSSDTQLTQKTDVY